MTDEFNQIAGIANAAIKQIDLLKAENEKLRASVEELTAIFELQRKRERPWIEQWQEETGKHHTLPDYGEMLGWIIGKAESAKADAEGLATLYDNTVAAFREKIASLEAALNASESTHAMLKDREVAAVARATKLWKLLNLVVRGAKRADIGYVVDADKMGCAIEFLDGKGINADNAD